ncbi:twin-arginine translocase TatA/TatE family subunit [Microbacterium sp.]|uniref:twin-arginine translocase TatA/TatE family subunit n=1 Tax=Microbacterium sp. TaxID=51671 RepID=UPI002E361E9B|nr:twin-arginine translocase TatA/TatE family subunit [Microbacterium sp.]HEX5730932.1 twin-arginine translocase TatA/TatE family subunit [Microbacterium sp.]
MLQNLTGWHALIILAVIILIFGAAKLPALAKSVGQSMRILKSEVAEPRIDSDAAASDDGGAVPRRESAGKGHLASTPSPMGLTVPVDDRAV